ncbi:MAG: hypothetical protein AB8G86_25975 [Saprospiraceae bacterium]
MEKLEMIWHKLDILEKALGQLVAKNAVKETYQQLKKEDSIHTKWTPLVVPYLLVMMAFITWITAAYTSMVTMAGIMLITCGAYVMLSFFQKNRIDLQAYEANPTAENFDEIIRKPLKQRVHYWALGVAIYTLSLTFGLHLLIFGVASLAGKGGLVGTFYGIMFGLTGGITGSMYAIHAKKYEMLFLPNYDLSFTDFKMQ